ncbi:hypothetical protein FLAG1_01396 [Fusarium langsethiae]|uniref:Uncharacterized protein n=1 Tax=Fusarium langsethiae TaxID=179993 RepID=A0A0M9F4B9_FUSLA|nr:hypothetical protein FLAG1_01396 [Fusarium langsethiae]
MKFTLFSQDALAIPFVTGALATPTSDSVKRTDCSLTVHYDRDWVESGLDIYRMWLVTNPRNDQHLDVYCDIAKKQINFGINHQCFWEDGKFFVDISVARGSAGEILVRAGKGEQKEEKGEEPGR